MTNSVIPEDIRQFLIKNIDSVAQLEGLLMCRADPQKEWNAEEIASGLYINASQAEVLLVQLLEKGFIVPAMSGLSLHYQYRPQFPESAEIIERLADLYRQYLVPVTNLIHAKDKTRIQAFANAFRIRKD